MDWQQLELMSLGS